MGQQVLLVVLGEVLHVLPDHHDRLRWGLNMVFHDSWFGICAPRSSRSAPLGPGQPQVVQPVVWVLPDHHDRLRWGLSPANVLSLGFVVLPDHHDRLRWGLWVVGLAHVSRTVLPDHHDRLRWG